MTKKVTVTDIFPTLSLYTCAVKTFEVNVPKQVSYGGRLLSITRTSETCRLPFGSAHGARYTVYKLNNLSCPAAQRLMADIPLLMDDNLHAMPTHTADKDHGVHISVGKDRLAAFAAAFRASSPHPFNVFAYFWTNHAFGTPALASHLHLRQYIAAALSPTPPALPPKPAIAKSLRRNHFAVGSYRLFPSFSMIRHNGDCTDDTLSFRYSTPSGSGMAERAGRIQYHGKPHYLYLLHCNKSSEGGGSAGSPGGQSAERSAALFDKLPVLFDCSSHVGYRHIDCVREREIGEAFSAAFQRAQADHALPMDIYAFYLNSSFYAERAYDLLPSHMVFRKWIDIALLEMASSTDPSTDDEIDIDEQPIGNTDVPMADHPLSTYISEDRADESVLLPAAIVPPESATEPLTLPAIVPPSLPNLPVRDSPPSDAGPSDNPQSGPSNAQRAGSPVARRDVPRTEPSNDPRTESSDNPQTNPTDAQRANPEDDCTIIPTIDAPNRAIIKPRRIPPAPSLPPTSLARLASWRPVSPERLHVYCTSGDYGDDMVQLAFERLCATNDHARRYGHAYCRCVLNMNDVLDHMRRDEVRSAPLPYQVFIEITAEKKAVLSEAYRAMHRAAVLYAESAARLNICRDKVANGITSVAPLLIEYIDRRDARDMTAAAFAALPRTLRLFFAVWRAPSIQKSQGLVRSAKSPASNAIGENNVVTEEF